MRVSLWPTKNTSHVASGQVQVVAFYPEKITFFLPSRSPVVVEQSDDLQGAMDRPADVMPAIDDRLVVTDPEPSLDNARRSEFPTSSLPSSQVSPAHGVTKRCRLSLLTRSALVIPVQMRGGGGGELRGLSQ